MSLSLSSFTDVIRYGNDKESMKNRLVAESYEQGIDILERKYNSKDAYEITDVATKRKWMIVGPKMCEIYYVNKNISSIREENKVEKSAPQNKIVKENNEIREDGLTQAEKEMMDEMFSMKDMMTSLIEQVNVVVEKSKRSGNELINGLEDVLVSNGVESDIASELIKKAINSIHPKFRENKNHIISGLKKVLVETIRVEAGYDADECNSVVFVGPTGVGKTTTLAKTATIFQQKGKNVGLITLDTYKLGAIDQMEEYAELLDVPSDACCNEDEVHTSIIRFMDKDCIFVDTMGHNPKDVKSNTQLKKMIDIIDPVEVTLVMSANMKTKDMYDCIEQFKFLGINSIIITKLDETNSLGEIINVCFKYPRYRMVYFTTGQCVPDDIEVAKAEKIVKAVITVEE